MRWLPLLAAVASLAALFGPSHAFGQGGRPLSRVAPLSLDPATKLDERLFLVYNLEEMYRRLALPPLADNPGPELRSDISRRRLNVDQMILKAERDKLGSGIITLLEQFKKDLVTFDALADELDVASGQHLAEGRRRFGPVKPLTGPPSAVLLTSIATLGPPEPTAGSPSKTIAAALAQRVRQEAVNANPKRPLMTAAIADFENQLAEEYTRLFTAFEAKQAKAMAMVAPRFRAAVAVLAKELDWPPSEADVMSNDLIKIPRPRDPFHIEAEVQARTYAADRAGIEARTTAAEQLLNAVRLVPRGKEYDDYRARLLGQAGLLINEACRQQLGVAGFEGGPASAARLAVQVWSAYVKYSPAESDPGGRILHQYVLANAFGKRYRTAYAAARMASRFQSRDPRFWYDAARICSLAGDVANAQHCLTEAVLFGFQDKPGAMVCPDLALLRKANPKGFDDALAGRRPSPPPKKLVPAKPASVPAIPAPGS